MGLPAHEKRSGIQSAPVPGLRLLLKTILLKIRQLTLIRNSIIPCIRQDNRVLPNAHNRNGLRHFCFIKIEEDDMQDFQFRPIGIISTPYRTKSGVPIQGVFDKESRGHVELYQEYEPGLKDIEEFSHLILVYVFDRSLGFDLICKPYMEDKEHGVFSMRSPQRPNPIGISVVRLEKREGNMLYLSEVDMLDQTPLLDIKPFVPKFDHRENVKVGWMERTFRDREHRKVSDERF
jgi:tRNA-Thr(GGU) m(6)t(6)A37 methyltransferase TsaA